MWLSPEQRGDSSVERAKQKDPMLLLRAQLHQLRGKKKGDHF